MVMIRLNEADVTEDVAFFRAPSSGGNGAVQ